MIRATGELHLVLLVKEGRAVFVLDNLDPLVARMHETMDRYVLVRVESERNPQTWTRVVAGRVS